MTEPLVTVSLEPVWSTIRDIRAQVGAALAAHPDELRTAAMMATSELLENAVKYGESLQHVPRILFDLTVAGDSMRIKIVNGTTDPRNVARLRAVMEVLAGSDDPKARYLSCIEEAAVGPLDYRGGGLGLYRVAAEGRFSLSYRYEEGVISVLASRSIR